MIDIINISFTPSSRTPSTSCVYIKLPRFPNKFSVFPLQYGNLKGGQNLRSLHQSSNDRLLSSNKLSSCDRSWTANRRASKISCEPWYSHQRFAQELYTLQWCLTPIARNKRRIHDHYEQAASKCMWKHKKRKYYHSINSSKKRCIKGN